MILQGLGQKHKTLKHVWLCTVIVSSVAGVISVAQLMKYFNEFKTATTDADQLKSKYKTYGVVSGIAFGMTAICGVQVYIQARKQSATAKQVALQLTPIHDGAFLSLQYKFK